MNADINLMVVNVIQSETGIMVSVDEIVKKTIKHRICQEDYAWNTSICACKRNKNCDIGEYIKDCTGTKRLIVDLIVTYDEIVDMQETTSINPDNQTNNNLLLLFY